MTAATVTYAVRLTTGERAALTWADADGWFGFYGQYSDFAPADVDSYCHDHDCTPEEMRAHIAEAAAAKLTDTELTLVPDSMLETDIVHHLQDAFAPFSCVDPSMKRAVRSLLKKMLAANPDLEVE